MRCMHKGFAEDEKKICESLEIVRLAADGIVLLAAAAGYGVLTGGGARRRGMMKALQLGDSISTLIEQMTMRLIFNTEYVAIGDINITITGYAIGTEDVSVNPTEAWNQGNIR